MEKNKLSKTYIDYLCLANMKSKPFLMIAELIDNSISSMDNEYGLNWKRKLKINIEIDIRGNIIDEIDGIKFYRNHKIIVKDNGFGISRERLKNAITLNGKVKSSSKMNVYGRGLKQSAFFFGVDLTVNTNDGVNKTKTSLKYSECESQYDEVNYIEEEGNREERGTDIYIENLVFNNNIRRSNWENIKETLEFRYIKYLNNEDLEITFSLINDIEEWNGKFNKKYEQKACIKSVWDNIDTREKIDSFIEETKKSIEVKLQKGSLNAKLELKIINKTMEKISTLLLGSLIDKELKFEFSQMININKKDVNIKIWLLPIRQSAFRGIRLFENNRAICHPPELSGGTESYMGWHKGALPTGSTPNRFAGSINLSKANLICDFNKSNFTMPIEVKDEFNKQIYSIWWVFNEFVMEARKENKYLEPYFPNLTKKRSVVKTYKTKYNLNIVKNCYISPKDQEVTFISKYDKQGEENRIKIIINGSRMPKELISFQVINGFAFNITLFSGHSFWKKSDFFMKEGRFFNELLYPFGLFMALFLIKFSKVDQKKVLRNLNKASEAFYVNDM